MQTIKRWGNSLAVRLPKDVLEKAHLSEGMAVEIEEEGGHLILRPARPRYTLNELLEGHGPEHRHGETDLGPATGNESW